MTLGVLLEGGVRGPRGHKAQGQLDQVTCRSSLCLTGRQGILAGSQSPLTPGASVCTLREFMETEADCTKIHSVPSSRPPWTTLRSWMA